MEKQELIDRLMGGEKSLEDVKSPERTFPYLFRISVKMKKSP